MFGIGSSHFIVLFIQIAITISLIKSKNPHPKGSQEYQALTLSRVGMGLAVWAFGFGLMGVLLSAAGIALAVVAIVKGETKGGVIAIAMCAATPLLGFIL